MSSISPKIFGQKFPFRNWNFSQISTWLSGSKCSAVTLICFQTCVASSIKPYHQHHFPERYSRVLKLNGKILREPETCSLDIVGQNKSYFCQNFILCAQDQPYCRPKIHAVGQHSLYTVHHKKWCWQTEKLKRPSIIVWPDKRDPTLTQSGKKATGFHWLASCGGTREVITDPPQVWGR